MAVQNTSLEQPRLLPFVNRQRLTRADFVRPARRLRQAIPRRAGENELEAARQIDQMTGRDVQRRRAGPRAQDRADDLGWVVLIGERGVIALVRTGFDRLAVQARLGDADRRARDPQPQVRGDAQATRVRDTLPIDQHQVGLERELLPRRQERGRFAETEQAGNVREGEGNVGGDGSERLEVRVAKDGDRRAGRIGLDRDVDARDAVHRAIIPLQHQPIAQFFLKRDGFIGREVPGVEHYRGLTALSRFFRP